MVHLQLQVRLLVHIDSPHIDAFMSHDLFEEAHMAWTKSVGKLQVVPHHKADAVSQTLTSMGYKNSRGVLTEDGLLSQDIHLHGELAWL